MLARNLTRLDNSHETLKGVLKGERQEDKEILKCLSLLHTVQDSQMPFSSLFSFLLSAITSINEALL